MVTDEPLFGVFREIKVSLTTAQIKTANSVPVDVAIPLPDTNEFIEVISASFFYNYVAAVFTSTHIQLKTDTASYPQFSSDAILNVAADVNGRMIVMPTAQTTLVLNKKLYVTANADSAVGDGNIDIYVFYRVVTL